MGFLNYPILNRSQSGQGRHGRIKTLILAALVAAVAIPARAPAQTPLGPDNEPVVVVTLGSLTKLMDDVNYITGVVGQPGAGGMFQMMAATFTNGIDTTQPIGVLVPMVNGMPEPIAVIPTKDVKMVLKRLEAQTGPVDELDDGTLVIAVNANTVYIRQVGNWAVAGRTRDVLALAPEDPTTLFKGMGNAYDLAFKVRMQEIPPDTRDMLIGQMRQGFEQAMQQQNDQAGREMGESAIAQMEMMLEQSDTITFGLNIDKNNRKIDLDFGYTALPGTKLANVYGSTGPVPSKFASVIRDDAAAYIHSASSISPDAVEMVRGTFDGFLNTIRGAMQQDGSLSEQDRVEIMAMVDRVGELYMKSVSEGKMDLGGLLLANEDDFRFALGGFVADGKEAAQIVKDIAEKVEGETDAPTFQFDIAEYNGVMMHLVEAEVPAREDEARRVFGDVLRVHIGTGPKSVYVAVGKNSEAMMKKLIDSGASDTGAADRPITQMRFNLLPVLKFAQSVEDNEAVAGMIQSLSGAADPGVVNVIGRAIKNGSTSKISIGEGLIQALGVAAQRQAPVPGQF